MSLGHLLTRPKKNSICQVLVFIIGWVRLTIKSFKDGSRNARSEIQTSTKEMIKDDKKTKNKRNGFFFWRNKRNGLKIKIDLDHYY